MTDPIHLANPGAAGSSNNAPAPEPSRTLSLDETLQPDVVTFNPETQEVTTPPGTLQSTPPPAAPDLTAQIEELRANYGQAINALGDERKQRTDLEQRLAELQLQMEAMAAAPQTPPGAPAPAPGIAPQPGPLPPGFTEEQLSETPTYRDLLAFGQQLAMHQQQQIEKTQADLIRSTWDITPEEEQQILSRFPTYNQLPELQKVHQIKRAVDMLLRPKESTSPQPATPAPLPAAPTAPATAPAPTPLANAPVPHVEHGASAAPDPQPFNAEAEAMAEYVAARRITNPREREQAMTAAAEKLARAKGTTLDGMTGGAWHAAG